jgi:hypothetical protein
VARESLYSEAAGDIAASLPPVNKVINRDFVNEADRLLIAIKNLIERSLSPPASTILWYPPFLLVCAHAARNTFTTVRYLVADSPRDPDRRLEFCLSISPLIRFLADLLFAIIVIRQKPRKYVMWYYRSGWRELKESLDRLKAEQGSSRRFSREIARQERALEHLRKQYRISRRLASFSDKIPYWPYPGQMLKNKHFRIRPRRFLAYLNTWFYSELSQDSHMSSAGLARMYSKLVIEPNDVDREKILKRIKSNNFMLTLTLCVAIATELNDIGLFDRGQKLSYIWKVLSHESFDAKRLFNRRYKAMVKRQLSY